MLYHKGSFSRRGKEFVLMIKITRKSLVLATYFCIYTAHMYAEQQESHTFLTLRPIFISGSPERETLIRSCVEQNLSFIQVVPLYGRSNAPDHFGRYFNPAGKSTLFVAEDLAMGNNSRDINPSSFNLKTVQGTYKSQLAFTGYHVFSGFGIAWRQQLCDSWWLELAAPFLRVENRLCLRERILDDGEGPVDGVGLDNSPYVGTMVQAFKQSNWRYGKIDSKVKLVKEGIGDVEFKIGYQSQAREELRLYGYVGAIFPTGNLPNARYVFEPMVGNNHHYGFLYGSHVGINAWRHDEHKFDLIFDVHTRYLFRNVQRRSFDIKDKEFSRYLEVYKNPQQARLASELESTGLGTSGINVFTKQLRVFPGFSVMFMNSALYRYKALEVEAGYNFFARQAEKVEIDWDRSSAVKDVGGLGGTNRARTIQDNFSCCVIPLDEYNPVLGRDLSQTSAAMPAELIYTIFGALGYYVQQAPCPVLLGIGGAYELNANFGLNRWYMWGKLSISF